jgi:hypothetical protein
MRNKQIEWDEIPANIAKEPFMLLVEGEHGSGKTHLAMTFPEPIFILDTENRADKVAAKFAGRKEVYRKRCQTFDEIRQTLLQLVFPHFKGGTVVIDSGTELQRYAESEYLEEAKKERIYPTVLWARVFAKVDNLLSTLRDQGFYTVITARLKDEYIGSGEDARKSGERVLDGYRRLPYLVDIYLRLPGDGNAIVLKNGFRNTPVEQKTPLKAPSFETIVGELIKTPKVPEPMKLDRVQANKEEDEKPQARPEGRPGPEPMEEVKEPEQVPLEGVRGEDEPAGFEEVNKVYRYGRDMGLDNSSLQHLIYQARGTSHRAN